jgi:uncharacterized repeat protein (TIGR03803 family)
MPTFITRLNFNNTNRGTNGGHRVDGLFAEAAGDFSGTTAPDGANGGGTVFGIPSIDGSDAGTPASFIGTDGTYPDAGLTSGAAGDLSGTTIGTFTNTDTDTTAAAATDNTTVAAAVPTLTTLVSFDGANGAAPIAGLTTDAARNLFGTTYYGGANGDGTVFEIAKTGGSYASTPTVLARFNGTNGANPVGGLITDAAGDLFGTTYYGGANGDGTVFEIAKASGSYASTPTTLVSFNYTDGAYPVAGLILLSQKVAPDPG